MPRNQQPTVLSSGNGVPVVNIQTPNTAGVSVNAYRQFDVGANGAILNNARGVTQTQLGGHVQGNPWLATGAARVIVNQVNSANPSYLRGYVEVAGDRAQVVIANPAGITCSGCGFINANRATLTTGTPVMSGGNLEAYRVGGGVVTVEGAGMDASTTSYADIIARAVRINAGVWAQDLKVSAGLNTVSADHASVVPGVAPSEAVPAVAIDVAQLGGMYAQHIYLASTEHGVGVRNAGTVGAAAGDAVVTADGRLENSGSMTAAGALAVRSSGALVNTGTLGSNAATSVEAASLENRGTVSAATTLALRATDALVNVGKMGADAGVTVNAGALDNAGTLSSAQATVDVTAAGQVNTSGRIEAAQSASVNAAGIDNSGTLVAAGPLALRASGALANTGTIGSNAAATLNAGSLDNRGSVSAATTLAVRATDALANAGKMSADAGVTVNAGALDNAGTLSSAQASVDVIAARQASSRGRIEAAQSVSLNAAGLDNGGTLAAGATMTIRTSGALANSGAIGSNGAAIIDAASLDNRGTLSSAQAAVGVTTTGQASNSGRIEAAQSLTLNAAGLDNGGTLAAAGALAVRTSGAVVNTGAMGANGAASIDAASLDNRGTLNSAQASVGVTVAGTAANHGRIVAAQALTLTASGLDNSGGTIAGTDLSIDARAQAINNQQGSITAQHNATLAGGDVSNHRGSIIAQHDLTLSGAALDNSQGSVAAQNQLAIASADLNNDGGLLQALGSLDIDAHGGTVSNTNSGAAQGIVSQGGLTLKAGALVNRNGYLAATGDIALTAATVNNDAGNIGSAATAGIDTASLSNKGGQLQAKTALKVNAAGGTVDNTGGLMRSDGGIAIQSATLRNDGTQGQNQGIEGAAIAITAADISNRQGAMRADTSLALTATGSVDNRAGLLSSSGTLSVTDTQAARMLALNNSGGTIVAAQKAGVTARSLSGDGKVLSQKDLAIDVVDSITNTGQIAATGDAAISTAGTFTNAGTVAAGAKLALTAGTIDNQASGSLIASTLQLKATDVHTFTNRGLIDGATTIIESSTVNNIGTGRIYGDNIAIGADVLNNLAETVGGVTTAAVIAARNRLDIGAGVINNSEHALIYSVGDMAIGGALDAAKRATGMAREINNTSATINADGNMSIAANSINNTNAHLETSEQTGPGNRIINYRLNGSSQLIDSSTVRLYQRKDARIVDAQNWRAMGDDSDFKLLLASARYPFEKYGPPFNYSKGRGGTGAFSDYVAGVGTAFEEAIAAVKTDDSYMPAVPEKYNYGPNDRIWDVFGIARPTAIVPEEPVAPLKIVSCGGDAPCENYNYENEYKVWKPLHDAWQATREAQLPSFLALNKAIADFNVSLRDRLVNEWTIYDGTEQVTRTVVGKSDPGMITAGGNMSLNAGVVNNYASQIIAGGTVAGNSVNGTAINNTGPQGTQTAVSIGSASYTYTKSHTSSSDDRRYDGVPYQSQTIVTNFQLDITPTGGAGPARSSSVRAVAAPVAGAAGAAGTALSVNVASVNPSQVSNTSYRIASLNLTLPNNALYRIDSAPNQRYLVQTDPQFIGYRTWLSSDFMLTQLQSTPGSTVKKLGDGFYEQQLVQQQIQQAVGQRYLAGYTSNEAQYMALMTAGVQQAKAFNYTVGVALSATQIAQLTSDIVWMVKQTVTLADGSTQEVLVPQVYLRASNVQVTGQGTLIAGSDVAFQTAQDIVNSGATIAARQSVSLAGNNIQNLGGRISGANTVLSAATDINNLGGAIDAQNNLVAMAGRDINSASTTVATANAVTTGTNINQVASMTVTGNNGTLAAVAGRDLNLQASSASADNIKLSAQRDVNLSTVHETSQEKLTWDSDNRAEVNRDNAIGSTVQGKSIALTAGRDINSQAAYVTAEGALAATAGNNINIGTDISTASARDQHKKSDSGGMLASRTVTTDDSSSQAIHQGSTFSGNTVVARAGSDLNITGSNVVSTQGTALAAGSNVNIVAAIDNSSQHNYRNETTSGVMGAGAGVTVGTREQSHDVNRQGQTASASTVGSTDGNVSIAAGNRYTQVGSDVVALKGDIDIAAKSVEIRAADQVSRTVTEDKFKQSGLTVAVTSPVISAVQTVQQMSEAAEKTKDGRMQALALANIGFAGANAMDAIKAGQGSTIDGKANQIATGPAGADGKTPSRDATDADKVGGINLALSLGGSSSESRSEQTTNTVRGSTVAAGGNVNITAQGGGADSNIVIQGSDIKAGVNATLKAANEVRLLAAQSTSEQHSSNQSMSGSIGASIGTDGLMFNASASGGCGHGDGSDVTQVNTHVDAGNKLTISSGTDATLKGAVVSGKQVVMDVGTSGSGDLNIESLQDTSTYKSDQQSLGGSISVGMGQVSGSVNYSKSSTNSNYASVMEQSGIKAGDGGFQINVRGNTDLKGAVIASTDKAVADGKNSLATATLTQSDIKNAADYDAQSVGIGIGYSTGKDNPVGRNQKGDAQTGGARVPGADLPTTGKDGGFSATPPVVMGASGSSSSTTRSGISGGAAIMITDDKKQQELTGKTAEQTVASVNRDVSSSKDGSNALKPIFEEKEINNRFTIVGAFTREAGAFLANRVKESTEAQKELDNELSKPKDQQDIVKLAKLEQTLRDNEKWDMAGPGRLVLTAVSGGIAGNVAGSTGSFIKSAAAYYFQGLATQEVKGIADLLDSDSARAALQGLVACAGAVAQNQSCGAGAAGSAASVVLNNLLNEINGDTASVMTH
ncbi:MAG: 16S rRNA endonuclease CdiA [Herbaspirillum frisingense]|uniref:16S rRNA endonuclease CdiA n=1 Tax=Herbaspirillum frisingense TaxID=92645 RepID=A0A7V8JTD4_9BURK|nr:MAG: 16S rRNA endonuclease CdiA [Herbaspirillum frisingense]